MKDLECKCGSKVFIIQDYNLTKKVVNEKRELKAEPAIIELKTEIICGNCKRVVEES